MFNLNNVDFWDENYEIEEFSRVIWVIDFHSHIWDILWNDGWWKSIMEDRWWFPIDLRTLWWYLGYKQPSELMQKILHIRFIEKTVLASGIKRNSRATLINFKKSIESSWVAKAVCLPIPPAVTFDDLKKAQDIDDRIITFTWVDFSKELDLIKLEAQFEKDIEAWAKWLKIHPILQRVSATSKQVNEVVEIFRQYDLPIIFHTWVTSYCLENCENFQEPKYGEIRYFEQLAKNHQDAKIVIWHSGLFQVDEVIEKLWKFDNVIAETSFQWEEKIRALFNKFWEERVAWASDWPYWDRLPSLKIAMKSVGWDQKKLTKFTRLNALRLMNMDR